MPGSQADRQTGQRDIYRQTDHESRNKKEGKDRFNRLIQYTHMIPTCTYIAGNVFKEFIKIYATLGTTVCDFVWLL